MDFFEGNKKKEKEKDVVSPDCNSIYLEIEKHSTLGNYHKKYAALNFYQSAKKFKKTDKWIVF